MISLKTNFQSGASIMEVLLVLTISAVLATLAVSQFGGAKSNLMRQNVARQFKNSLERARFDSVKRRASDASMATISVLNTTSYIVKTDINQNGQIDTAEWQTVDFSRTSNVQLYIPPGTTAPVSISFDQRGHALVQDFDGRTVDYFLFCGTDCTAANANSSNSSVVYISTTGTVTMLGGGESLPAVTDPTLSTVASDTGINSDLTVWVGAPPTPPPTPTVSPTTTPSVTPTPSPFPSPSASPTSFPSSSATPTATPTATQLPLCTLNERPGTPPTCLCQAPWFVGPNGKCGP